MLLDGVVLNKWDMGFHGSSPPAPWSSGLRQWRRPTAVPLASLADLCYQKNKRERERVDGQGKDC